MTQYLLSMHHSQVDRPSDADLQQIMQRVGAVAADAQAQGAWVFAGGLMPVAESTLMDATGGSPLLTDGPFAESHEGLGGITVLDLPTREEAHAWAARLSEASGLPIEVRTFGG